MATKGRRRHTTTLPVSATRRGRKSKFGTPIEKQISVGLDKDRLAQLVAVQKHLSDNNIGEMTASDVMRHAFDQLVSSLRKEVPELTTVQP